MADENKLQDEWQKLAQYAEGLSMQEKTAEAEAKKAMTEKALTDEAEGNEIQWLEKEEVRELEANAGSVKQKPKSQPKKEHGVSNRPTEKEGHSAHQRLSKKESRPRCSRPSEKDRQPSSYRSAELERRAKRSVPRRLPSEERHRQLRWLRNETWLTLNAKEKGATLEQLLKNLSLDGLQSVESRVKTLGYPCLSAFLKSTYMQHEVEVVCQEGKLIYFSKAKKGIQAIEKKLKESQQRIEKLQLREAGLQKGDVSLKNDAVAPKKPAQQAKVAPEKQAEAAPVPEAVAEDTVVQEVDEEEPAVEKVAEEPHEEDVVVAAGPASEKADDAPLAEDVHVQLDGEAKALKADGMEPLPLEAAKSHAEVPTQQEAARLLPKVHEEPEAVGPPADDVEMPEVEAPEQQPVAADKAIPEARNPGTPEVAVAIVNQAPHRHRVPAVSELTSLEELILANGPIRFTPMDADRRYKWQRRFQPGVEDVALVPAPAEPVPTTMRPVLEVALDALQQQPNPENLTVADIHRVLSEALVGKKVWTHEASMRFHVKKVSMDNAFEAEIRSQADVAARYAAQFPRRPPLQSRAPHCPVDMPLAAVFMWKAMPLQLP